MAATNQSRKTRIAHLSGPTATIQNTPPLVTSNKARAKHNLPLLTDVDGAPLRYDALRPQRLAAPAKVYVEQFSAHPLEVDVAELYGPPDGYISADGAFRKHREAPDDKPVYEIELRPEDGLYPLPYMARQADGSAWEEECTSPGAATGRQGFFPDGSRSFEEIDRLSVSVEGSASLLSSIATIDFHRGVPPGGYTKGLPAHLRTDEGEEDIPPEIRGTHFFGYKPYHLGVAPPRPALAKATNDMQALASSGEYDGIIWTQGSPQIEESAYWFNLLIDTTLPICINAAQRPQGQISADGPANIVDSARFIPTTLVLDDDRRACELGFRGARYHQEGLATDFFSPARVVGSPEINTAPLTVNELEKAKATRIAPDGPHNTIIGDSVAARENVQRFVDSGVDELIMVMQMGTVPHEAVLKSLRTFAEKVMPYIQAARSR